MAPTTGPADADAGVDAGAVAARIATAGPRAATDGFPVVFLHGQPGGAEVWDPVQTLLLGTGVHTVAIDRPGYGGTSVDAGGFRHNAEVLTRVLTTLGGPSVVVAHSWAAGPALLVARRSPELVAGLVLIAPVGDPRSVTLLDRWLARGRFGRLLLRAGLAVGGWLVQRPGGEHLLHATGIGHLGPPDARSAARPALDRRARRAAAVEQLALVEELVEVGRAARHVRVPTVVLGGTHDGVVRPAAVKGLARAIPRARLRMLDGSHLLPMEHPGAVADTVLGMVAVVRGRQLTTLGA